MELYYGKHTCAIGIHLLLEEIGAAYTLHELNIKKNEQFSPEFTKINPKSKVPVLVRDDGSVVTEFGVIAQWLARAYPDKALLPSDLESETRALEILDYVVGTLHGEAFSRVFMPQHFTPSESDLDEVRARGREIAEKGFKIISDQLGSRDYAIGQFSIADAALFYVENWADQEQVAMPGNLETHLARMKDRPAVRNALYQQGQKL